MCRGLVAQSESFAGFTKTPNTAIKFVIFFCKVFLKRFTHWTDTLCCHY